MRRSLYLRDAAPGVYIPCIQIWKFHKSGSPCWKTLNYCSNGLFSSAWPFFSGISRGLSITFMGRRSRCILSGSCTICNFLICQALLSLIEVRDSQTLVNITITWTHKTFIRIPGIAPIILGGVWKPQFFNSDSADSHVGSPRTTLWETLPMNHQVCRARCLGITLARALLNTLFEIGFRGELGKKRQVNRKVYCKPMMHLSPMHGLMSLQ